MKPHPTSPRIRISTRIARAPHGWLAVFCLALLAGTLHSRAQNGTWTSETDGLWSNAGNWLDGIIASGAGNSATFSNEFGSPVTVDLDSARTIGNLTFVQGTFTLTNDGSLTLAGPSKPVITVPGGMSATIRRTIMAGTDGFVLEGGGTLNLYKGGSETIESDPPNTWSGSVILDGSTLQVLGDDVNVSDFPSIANDAALDGLTSFTFLNGATLNMNYDGSTGPNYGTVDAALIVPEGQSGTIILPPRWAGSVGDNAAAIGTGLGGTLTGSGTLNVSSRYLRGNIVGDWSAFTGLLHITPLTTHADNEFRFGNPAGFPNAVIEIGGGTPLTFNYYRSLTANTTMPIGAISSINPEAVLRGSHTAAFTLTLDIGALMTNATDVATFAGTIANGGGPAGLLKRGAGTLILTGNNAYTGPTTISNGVLQIGDGFNDSGAIGSGPITNHSALIFARGGSLLVSAPITGAGAITNAGFNGTLTLTGTNTYTAPTVVTAGKLIVGTASQATGAYLLRDSAEGFGAMMTSPGATLTVSSLSFGSPGTLDIECGIFDNPSAAVITNTGNLELNGDLIVNVAGTGLSAGTITLLQYGNRTGSGSFVLGSLPPHITTASLNDDAVNRRVTLTISATFDDTLQWVGDAAGVWDSGNPANLVWRVVGSGQLTNYYDGAKVRFDDSATGATTIELSSFLFPASVIVNSSTRAYTFTGFGSISGDTPLVKQGSSTLKILNANDYSGSTRIDAGTLQLGDGTQDGTIGGGAITNHGSLHLNRATDGVIANVITGTGNVVQNGPGVVTLTGNSSYGGGLTLKPGTTLAYNNGNAGGIGGGVRIESATLTLGADVAGNVGELVIISDATIRNTGANRVINPAIRGTNVVVVFDKTPNLITLNGDIQGISGIITNMGTGLLRFNSGGGNNAVGSPSARWVLATEGGFLQPRNSSVNHLGSVEGVGTLSASQSGAPTSVTWTIGALNTDTVFEGVINDGAAFGQATRYTALTKVGTGTLTLNNATLSYRSLTTISNGVLALAGTSSPEQSTNIVVAMPGILDVASRTDATLTLGAGAVSQTLRGNGAIRGNLVMGTNGRLEPGFSLGALTVTNSAQLGGVTIMEIDRAASPNSDRLVAQSITLGGALIVTNIGSALAPGDTFQLLSAPNLSGSFSAVTLPALDCPTLSWNTNQLAVNGTISVAGTGCVNTTPTNISFQALGDNTFELSWPESHTGWRLEVQVNPINVGLSNNWVTVEGSTLTNRMVISINPADGAVFYRLVYP